MVCSVVRRMWAVSWVVYSSPSTRVAYPSSEAAVWPPEAREVLAKERPVLQRELGRLEGRLELTEQADSTLREQLELEEWGRPFVDPPTRCPLGPQEPSTAPRGRGRYAEDLGGHPGAF